MCLAVSAPRTDSISDPSPASHRPADLHFLTQALWPFGDLSLYFFFKFLFVSFFFCFFAWSIFGSFAMPRSPSLAMEIVAVLLLYFGSLLSLLSLSLFLPASFIFHLFGSFSLLLLHFPFIWILSSNPIWPKKKKRKTKNWKSLQTLVLSPSLPSFVLSPSCLYLSPFFSFLTWISCIIIVILCVYWFTLSHLLHLFYSCGCLFFKE